MVCDLSQKKCVPCEGGVPPLSQDEIQTHLKNLIGWQQNENKIQKSFTFKDFNHLMVFINQMAELAEQEGHHPDFFVSYNKLNITLYTHAIDGLSLNDFILAAKIEELPR